MDSIDISQGRIKVCNQYIDVPQPMYVYHSEKELDENEQKDGQMPLIKIRSLEQYMYTMEKLGINESKYHSFLAHNIWIKTKDQFLPTYTNEAGETFYKLDENGNQIPIESGWVRLYKMLYATQKHMIYTSSGIWAVMLTKWDIGAGIKNQFSAVTRASGTREKRYTDAFNKILAKKNPGVSEMQAVSVLLNPMSPLFLDIDRVLNRIYRSKVKKVDRERLITSQAFRKAIMKEIAVLFPDLTKAIRDQIPPEKMAEFFQQIVSKSIKDESSSEAMDRMKDIVEMAYSTKTFEGYPTNVPLLSDPSKPALQEHKEETNLEEEKQAQSYPDSYVMDDDLDLPSDFETIIPRRDE